MILRIGTRKSKLALVQAEMAASEIKKAFPDIETQIVTVTTKGDIVRDRPLSEIGGTGVFSGELERALLENTIDIAVHSAKDMPLKLADGTCVCAVLKRGDPRDVLVTRRGCPLPEVPVIGTSSKRRAAGIQRMILETTTADIRGNVETRLNKLADGQYDAIILAMAGLERLGMLSDERFDFASTDTNTIVPAPCQGIIAVQSRSGELSDILQKINDSNTYLCFETERKVLELLNSGCSSPAGAVSLISGGKITLTVTKDQHRKLIDTADTSERQLLAERLVKAL